MPFDENVAERLREAFRRIPGAQEKRMFGGLAIMVGGHMCCGVIGDELMVRVGSEAYDEALSLPGVREMDFTGKPLRGFVYVAADAFETAASLQEWVERGLAFVRTLPPK